MAQGTDIPGILSELKGIAPAGFAMAYHVRFATPSFLLQSYPADWIALYSQQGLVMHDPTVHWGFANTGMVAWSELVDQDPQGVIRQAADYGMTHGLTYAANREDSLTVTSFARSDRDFTDVERESIESGVNAIHDATLHSETLGPGVLESLKKMSITLTLA